MVKKSILVTGAEGQLGRELRAIEKDNETSFYFTSSSELDITNRAALEALILKNAFTHCVNCAAYTNVEKAEEEPGKAFAVNAEAAGVLAELCEKHGIFLIHISTDFVFDGEKRSPYKPNDATNPLNVYGASKLKGEQLVLSKNPRTAVIRTSWLYNGSGKNFVNTILSKLRGVGEVKVVNDQFGSPTFAGDLAEAIIQIIHQPAFAPGIFHYCNKGVISWFQFAEAVRDISGINKEVIPVKSSDFLAKAKRPAYSALDCIRIKEEYGIEQKDWRESLIKCLA